jgi:hypothetical protein
MSDSSYAEEPEEDSVAKRVAKGLDGSKRKGQRRSGPSVAPSSSSDSSVKSVKSKQTLRLNKQLKTNFSEIPQFVNLQTQAPPLLSQVSLLPVGFGPNQQPQYQFQPTELQIAMATARAMESLLPGIPTFTAATPEFVIGKPKGRKKKGDSADKPKAVRKVEPLPPELINFSYEDKHRIQMVDETDPANGNIVQVANMIVTGNPKDGTKKKWMLDELRSEQLRALAKNMECANIGSVSKFVVRKEIARRVLMGPIYKNMDIPNPISTSKSRRLNTMFRLINCCFLPENIHRLTQINDTKLRHDFEATEGGKGPNEDFWHDISEMVNDAANNDTLKVVLQGETNEYLIPIVESLNLADYTQGTWKTVRQTIKDLLRARATVAKKMKLSGHHSNDIRTYLNRGNMKVRKDVYMLEEAVYYIDLRATEHPAIDQAFTEALKIIHKSSSDAIPESDDEVTDGKNDGRVKQKDFLTMLEKANDVAAQNQLDTKDRQLKLISMQEESTKVTTARDDWSSYISACRNLLELRKNAKKNDAVSTAIISNIALRIKSLEDQLGIPEERSAVKELL